MRKNKHWTFRDIAVATTAFCCMLFVHGAVPFVMAPDLLSAVWSMGFAQSLANNATVLDVFARDIGIPGPASMAFGLAGAYPASLLMRLGVHAADAYSFAAALWFAVAFVSTIRISSLFGASKMLAVVIGCTWLSMPIIWAHSSYCMVSWGMALLPFYFWAAFGLFRIGRKGEYLCAWSYALYLTATLVAIFMDGYTFMMFVTGSTILLFYEVITSPGKKRFLLISAAPTHFASFAISYLLYTLYIGKLGFEAHSTDFFRGWGLDLAYIALPTKGILWVPDFLGVSVPRSNEVHFGDLSVWVTTFFLPLAVLGVYAWWRVRRNVSVASGILLVALFSFYMSLGPSLKINSTKPLDLQLDAPREKSALMPAKYAVIPTGNAWISDNLPGFNVMRGSYRWAALTVFSLWLLVAIWLAERGANRPISSIAILIIFMIINLPNIRTQSVRNYNFRNSFLQMDKDLVYPLKSILQQNTSCVFAPTGNDWMVNYFVPKSGLISYNIGGDKNIAEAVKTWPEEISGKFHVIDEFTPETTVKALLSGQAEAVIFPHFHLLESGRSWPPHEREIEEFKSVASSVTTKIAQFPFVTVTTKNFFTIVQLSEEFHEESVRFNLRKNIRGSVGTKPGS